MPLNFISFHVGAQEIPSYFIFCESDDLCLANWVLEVVNLLWNVLKFPSFVMCFIGVDLKKVDDCVGDPEADVDNQVLKAEQDAQVSS